ncbi:MAG: DUF433 domain-containing protein [Chloroflexi bacterium]|nr:DUF433 domain-containing protein [Chloroflexota bacterium]
MVVTKVTEIVPIKKNRDGVILVSNTRVTLDTIIGAFNDGATAEEIAYQYPSVPLADIYSVIGYYLRQKKQVDTYLRRREKQAREIRAMNEKRFNSSEIRDRLIARARSGKR